jgi:hypothetical protein
MADCLPDTDVRENLQKVEQLAKLFSIPRRIRVGILSTFAD